MIASAPVYSVAASLAEVPFGMCACGCGEELNPYFRPVCEMRDHGLTFRQIGTRLGISHAYAAALIRNPPRFIKGHAARTYRWERRACLNCGTEFSTCTGDLYCSGGGWSGNRRGCAALHDSERRTRWATYDEARAADRLARRCASNPQLRWALALKAAVAEVDQQAVARAFERRQQARADQHECTRSEFQQRELEALIAAQTREMDRSEKSWGERPHRSPSASGWLSLDEEMKSQHPDWYSTPATGLDLLCDHRHNGADSFTILMSQEFDSIVGDLTAEDVERMNDSTLEHLRSRLLDAGITTGAVQQKERERLREPERHRGSAPSPTRERKSSRHRGRREQKALMAGKRTSRKQHKRWQRERIEKAFELGMAARA